MIPMPANPAAMLSTLKRIPYNELRVMQHICKTNFREFARVFFKERTGTPFIWNWHHGVICNVLQRVVDGIYPRVIINLPPGFTKTELIVKLLNGYSFARNPRAKNLHLSYSADLAWDGSTAVKDIVLTDLFQALYPGKPRIDSHSKRTWKLETNGQMVAGSIGGQVTGRRAGRLEDGFQGVLTIDDPIKPEDTFFQLIRDKRNRSFKTTIRSRVARPETPVVLIMQRLHEDDPSGFLLRGGTGEKWHHLVIPAEIDEQQWNEGYPAEYTHGIPINYLAPFGLTWPLKINEEFAEALKDDLAIWLTQYQQDPTAEVGEIFHNDWWRAYDHYDPINSCIVFEDGTKVPIAYKAIYADTAQKREERHDWSVFQLWAVTVDGRIALIDQEREKYEAPELQENFDSFIERYQFQAGVENMGVRLIRVEDKSSGTGLIQTLGRKWPIDGIPRDRDKVSRAKSCAPEVKKGRVLLPLHAEFLAEYVKEFHKFNSAMTHKHDDQVDATMDAIEDNLIGSPMIGYGQVI